MKMNDIGSLQDARDAAVRVWSTLADGRWVGLAVRPHDMVAGRMRRRGNCEYA